MSITTRRMLTDAYLEIGVLASTETMSAADAQWALSVLARLLDDWNAERPAVYADQFLTFTLTPSLNPHTIGPTGATWTTARPVSIDGVNLILNTVSPTVQMPITLHDAAWFQSLSVPSLESTFPTDGYYDPTYPNGSLYLYPVPTAAYQVQLWVRTVLAELDLNDTFTMPPGYRNAITLTVAEMLAESSGRQMPALLPIRATQARARIFANNVTTPSLQTQDSGMPTSGRELPYFNYRTGQSV